MFLPVNKTEVQRVAVIGPNANLSKSIALIAAAEAADLVVLTLGLDGTVEGEGDDRTSIDLPSSS